MKKTIIICCFLFLISGLMGWGIARYRWLHSQTHYVYVIQEGLMKFSEGDNVNLVHKYEEKLLRNSKDFDKCSGAILNQMNAVETSIKNSNSCGDTKYLDIIYDNTDNIVKACQ